jgi:hypothetical protein
MEPRQTSLLNRIRELAVGDSVTVNVDEYGYNTVRRYASDCGLYLDRIYSTHLDRVNRTYTVTRKS